MGKLLTIHEIRESLDAHWYFEDAYYSHSNGNDGYVFKWPNPSFPYMHAINLDTLDNTIRIRIRRWIEHTITDTVILDSLDNNYRVKYRDPRPGESDWDVSYDIRNIWVRFFFEDENTALMFKTTFSDYIKPVTKWNPKYPENEELFRDKS